MVKIYHYFSLSPVCNDMESISVTVINFVLMMLMFETCCSLRMQPSVLSFFLNIFFVNIVFKISIFDKSY